MTSQNIDHCWIYPSSPICFYSVMRNFIFIRRGKENIITLKKPKYHRWKTLKLNNVIILLNEKSANTKGEWNTGVE